MACYSMRSVAAATRSSPMLTGPTHPDYTVLFTGVRGSGKTVMLNAAEDLARRRGWLTLSENASPVGLLRRLAVAASARLADLHAPGTSTRMSGVTAAGFGVTLEHDAEAEGVLDLRSLLSGLGALLAERGTGMIITIDELQSGNIDELREFGAVLQHVTRREQHPIAFAGASLPTIDDTLLSDDDIATFLQRCSRYDIDRIEAGDAAAAIVEPIVQRGGSIDDLDLERAVAATSGYAFMIQLVGFHTRKAASDPTAGITSSEAPSGIAEAERRVPPPPHPNRHGHRGGQGAHRLRAPRNPGVDSQRGRLRRCFIPGRPVRTLNSPWAC